MKGQSKDITLLRQGVVCSESSKASSIWEPGLIVRSLFLGKTFPPPFMCMGKLVWPENNFKQRFGRISVILPDNEADICGYFASFPS